MGGIGKTIGQIAGGALGSVIAPGVGTAIGSSIGGAIGGSIGKNGAQGESKGSGMGQAAASGGLGGGLGLLQSIQANKLKREAEANLPAFTDPTQAAFLAELQQKRRSIDTGADFAAGMNTIDTTNAGTNEAITRNTGGDVGGTIQALLQSQGVANQGKNQVLAQGQQQQMQYNQMYQGVLNRIEQRKLELQMYRSQQARAEWAKKQQQANQSMMAGLGKAASGVMPQESVAQGAVATPNNQQGMDWLNPSSSPSMSGDAAYNYKPIAMQDNGGASSIDLSILNQGAL